MEFCDCKEPVLGLGLTTGTRQVIGYCKRCVRPLKKGQ
jgi:hypothetical protein